MKTHKLINCIQLPNFPFVLYRPAASKTEIFKEPSSCFILHAQSANVQFCKTYYLPSVKPKSWDESLQYSSTAIVLLWAAFCSLFTGSAFKWSVKKYIYQWWFFVKISMQYISMQSQNTIDTR